MDDGHTGWKIAGVVGVIGVSFAVLYWMKRRSQMTLLGDYDLDLELGPPPPADPHPGEPYVAVKRPILTQSYSLTQATPIRVATGFPGQLTKVTVVSASPAGQSALLSGDVGSLNAIDTTLPVGNVVVIPVGNNPQPFHLNPGEGLFAKATQDGVLISVSSEGE